MIQNPSYLMAICGVYLLGLFFLFGRGVPARSHIPWLAVLFWIFGIFPIIRNLTVPRDLNYMLMGSGGWHMEYQMPELLIQIGQLSMLFVLICAFALFSRISREGLPYPGRALWITFLLSTTGAIFSTFFGLVPAEFSDTLIKPAVFFTVFYLAFNQWPEKTPLYAKRVCLIFLIGSILAAIFQPHWAVLIGKSGMVSGFSSRLFGVAANPNALGPLALLYLYIDFSFPTRSSFRWVGRLLAFVILIWAQSKTIWVAAVVGFTLKLWFGSGVFTHKSISKKRLVRLVIIAGPLIVLSFIFCLPDRINPTEMGLNLSELSNFSGRFELWWISIEEWRRSPLFGYGMNLWDDAFKAYYGLQNATYASHAHSMYIQTLGATGLYGLTMFIVFVLALLRTAWNTMKISKGWSLSLVSLPLIRGVSESSFICKGIGENVFYEMAVIGMLITWQWMQQGNRRNVDHAERDGDNKTDYKIPGKQSATI